MPIINATIMKLCIPTTEQNGLQSKVSEHFGRAPFHIVIDLETQAVSDLVKQNDCNDEDHGHCMPVDLLIENGVNMVACKGIGRGAVARLLANNIAVFSTTSNTVENVVKEYQTKILNLVSEDNICEGHHH
jgi:predicted Fe-Mo cluster-binding NifX family protein